MIRKPAIFSTAGYLILICLVLLLLYMGRILFIPMSYGLFIAVVLYPVCSWLEKHRWPRSLAVGVSLSIVVLLFAGLIWLLVLQLRVLEDELPELKEKIQPSLAAFRDWLVHTFGFTLEGQDQWWQQQKTNLGDAGALFQTAFRNLVNNLFILFITPVFSALFLYNRAAFVQFVKELAGEQRKGETDRVLKLTVNTYFRYIKGMVMVYLIVGVLNSAGLLLLGVRHALLFGFLTAIMTMIPYVGIVISALLPVTLSWIDTGTIWVPLGIIAVFSLVQYLEANIIFPKVVGTQLNVSTWAMLVFIVAGSIIWGMSGMILFIPLAGVLKILTDHMEEWKAWNTLLSR